MTDADTPRTGHADEVAFLIRPNAGLPFAPVAETASGGELSRIALAIAAVGLAIMMGMVIYHVKGGIPAIWHTASEGGITAFTKPIPGWEGAGLFEKIRLYFARPNEAEHRVQGHLVRQAGQFAAEYRVSDAHQCELARNDIRMYRLLDESL